MLNHVTLMGRLVADPELRHTPNNVAVTKFTIAVDRNFAKQGEEKKTDFIDIQAWRNTAEFICKYFTKGRMIAIEGALQVDRYTDKEGNKRNAVFISASDVYFADSKNGSSGTSAPASTERQPSSENALPDTGYAAGEPDDFAVVEDDGGLPF
ncbi:MAG: single-stranded DNA-binding protein [Oscillospiraceae bacterium]